MSDNENIFAGDALNRVGFANNLARLAQNSVGGVIAVDGEWGAGKTWLGRRVSKLLTQGDKPAKVVWIDTFSSDWDDDPALSLLAELSEQLPTDKRDAFIEKVAPLAGRALIAAGKTGVKALGNLVGLDKETIDEAVAAAQDAEEAYIKGQLKKLADRKKSLSSLKELLSNAVNDCGGKVVVFVDELDRCSPVYAIRFLERIKHLFDVKGVVYILLWNRDQIQHVVKRFYGEQANGQMYLDRFVDYSLHLPNQFKRHQGDNMGLVVESEIKKLPADRQRLLHDAGPLICYWAESLGMTAREVKRVCRWWVVSVAKTYEILEIWLLCLKATRPNLCALLRTEDAQGHQEAESLLARIQIDGRFSHIARALQEFHKACRLKDMSNADKFHSHIFGVSTPDALTITSKTISRIESANP